jgi:hypothetical protein
MNSRIANSTKTAQVNGLSLDQPVPRRETRAFGQGLLSHEPASRHG